MYVGQFVKGVIGERRPGCRVVSGGRICVVVAAVTIGICATVAIGIVSDIAQHVFVAVRACHNVALVVLRDGVPGAVDASPQCSAVCVQ